MAVVGISIVTLYTAQMLRIVDLLPSEHLLPVSVNLHNFIKYLKCIIYFGLIVILATDSLYR